MPICRLSGPDLDRFQFIGYTLLVIAFMLAMRVLVQIFRLSRM